MGMGCSFIIRLGRRRWLDSTRDFTLRTATEEQWLINNTGCPRCQKTNLGLPNPIEFEDNGWSFLERTCVLCDGIDCSEIAQDERAHRQHRSPSF